MAVQLLAGGLLLGLIVPLIVKVLLTFGVGFVAYTGADIFFTEAETFISAELGALPSDVYAILQIAGVVQGFAILFASYSAAVSIKVTLGAFNKISWTAPTV